MSSRLTHITDVAHLGPGEDLMWGWENRVTLALPSNKGHQLVWEREDNVQILPKECNRRGGGIREPTQHLGMPRTIN